MIQITQKPEEFCLDHCPYMNLHLNTSELYADGGVAEYFPVLRCEYEVVCYMWHEELLNSQKKHGL